MWQSLVIFLILGLSFIVFAFCQHAGKSKGNAEGSIATTKDSVINNGKSMNKKEIEEKLQILAKSETPDPKSLKMGAMCYSPTKLPPTVDYVCPVCGEKTIYTLRHEYFVVKKLPHSRSVAKALNSYGISLDESAFCSKCRKDSTEEPVLSLTVKYADQPEPRIIKGITYTDLNILYEFLHNKKIHVAENDREVPLKDYTDRLSFLLGVEINK